MRSHGDFRANLRAELSGCDIISLLIEIVFEMSYSKKKDRKRVWLVKQMLKRGSCGGHVTHVKKAGGGVSCVFSKSNCLFVSNEC